MLSKIVDVLRAVQRRVILSPRLAILGISRFTNCIWHLVSGRERHESALRALSFRATPPRHAVGCRSERESKEEVRREIRRTIRRKLDAFISRDFLSCSRATFLVLFFPPLVQFVHPSVRIEPVTERSK